MRFLTLDERPVLTPQYTLFSTSTDRQVDPPARRREITFQRSCPAGDGSKRDQPNGFERCHAAPQRPAPRTTWRRHAEEPTRDPEREAGALRQPSRLRVGGQLRGVDRAGDRLPQPRRRGAAVLLRRARAAARPSRAARHDAGERRHDPRHHRRRQRSRAGQPHRGRRLRSGRLHRASRQQRRPARPARRSAGTGSRPDRRPARSRQGARTDRRGPPRGAAGEGRRAELEHRGRLARRCAARTRLRRAAGQRSSRTRSASCCARCSPRTAPIVARLPLVAGSLEAHAEVAA